MGTLFYGQFDVDIDDRLLAHIQIVMVNKFRRGEALLMSWIDAPSIGDGRSAIWLNPHVPVYFKFLGSRAPGIDREWLAILTESADSSTGLVLQDEHRKLAHAAGKRGRH